MKSWQAYQDLKKQIDDFNESCPLLEMMANKAMKNRHWKKIGEITSHVFEVESETFLLKNIMEAPLLENKEDIEVRRNHTEEGLYKFIYGPQQRRKPKDQAGL